MNQMHIKKTLLKGKEEVAPVPALQQFIVALDSLSRESFPLDAVTRFLTTTPLPPEALEPYTFFSPQRYTRNLLVKHPLYEVLLLCWLPGQISPIHGHEGEKCWMRVELGELLFKNYSVKEQGSTISITLEHEASGCKGFVDGPAVVHRVENVTSKPAMSLHLYARPFAQCDVFDTKHQIKQKISLNYDSMRGKLINLALKCE